MSTELSEALGAIQRLDLGPVVTSLEKRRAEWLDDRRAAITGTDAGKILGVAPPSYGGPMSVYLEKVGELPEAPATPWRDSGVRLERPILEWYADQRGVPLIFHAPYTLVRAKDNPLLGVTLDALRTDQATPAPVDAKNIRVKEEPWGEPDTDQMPTYYAAQLVMQMRVTGADFADLAVLFSGQDLLAYRLYRDRDLEENVVARALEFWHDHVEKRIPPEVDGSRDWGEYLKRRFRQATEVVIPAEPEHHVAARELHEAEMAKDAATAHYEMIRNRLKLAIGDNKGMTGGKWRAIWSQEKDSVGVDWEKVAKNLSTTVELLKTAAVHFDQDDRTRLSRFIGVLDETPSLEELKKKNAIVSRRGARKFHFTFNQ
jgi:putative phage-type endonuclease